jgi:multisubunit Na+/H+ antiporter MnhB subunit
VVHGALRPNPGADGPAGRRRGSRWHGVGAQVAERRRSSPAALVAAAATASVLAITAAVNEPANHRFVSGSLTGPETTELLNEWARWHHVRVVLGLVATGAATVALAQLDDTGPRWPRRRTFSARAATWNAT